MENKPTKDEVRHKTRSIILIILGILVVIAIVSSAIIYSNSDTDSDITAGVSSKEDASKKEASSSSVKVDPIEVYNAPDNKIMPQDDGTITIEGKTAPNKKVNLEIYAATSGNPDNVYESTVSNKDGYFKFNFDNTKDPNLVNVIYCLDQDGSVEVGLLNDTNNYYDNKYLTLIKNENVDYDSFRNLYVQQHYKSHTSSDSSLTIDAEITFE